MSLTVRLVSIARVIFALVVPLVRCVVVTLLARARLVRLLHFLDQATELVANLACICTSNHEAVSFFFVDSFRDYGKT